ncbi:MAG: MATE family efflux transporter [Candidatus Theseobacter exili]|nr:MATE family efflux transporter [Candidatus Theseobacter exili]
MIRKMFNRNRDFTKGSILSGVVSLAIPLMIGSFLQSTQSLIDLYWVGSLGSASIAAVAISGTIIMILFTFAIGISMGTISLVARSIGAQENWLAGKIAEQSIFVGLLLSLAIGLAGAPFSSNLLEFLGADNAVVKAGDNYLKIILFGSPTMFLLFLGNSILQGTGDTIRPMLFMVIANILNIILDPIFIFGIGVPPMGTAGAALATIIGQGTAASLVFIVLHKKGGKIHIHMRGFRPNMELIRHILKIGLPSSLQMFFRSTMQMTVISLVTSFGTVATAAFGLVMRLYIVFLMPGFALGSSASTLVGQNLGAKKPDRARNSAWIATCLHFTIMTLTCFFFLSFAEKILGFFHAQPPVIEEGAQFMRTIAPFLVFLAFGVVLNRALGGAGDTLVPMLITFISLWAYLVPAAFFLSQHFGLQGIWWAVATSMLLNGLLTLAWFETGHWKKCIGIPINNK